jgi:NAD(P)-dependent dehydrogenase (short-subunit alcohol dehydrogenase family)
MTETTQKALVLGGSSGIGLATVRLLAQQGMDVHAGGRDAGRLARLTAEMPRITTPQVDARVRAELDALMSKIGPLDHLVITLTSSEGPGPFADLDLGMLRRAFDDKFWAHAEAIQAALPRMADDGSITLVGAITAHAGMPGTAGIGAVNAAVEALVRPLAVELAPRRVNAVSPGVVDTPWWSGMPEDARAAFFEGMASHIPSRRIATAEQIARAVALLVTDTAFSGAVLQADGGARLVSMG